MPYWCVVIHVRYCENHSRTALASARRQRARFRDERNGARDLDQVHRVDDADAAPRDAAMNRLRVQQMRIHARGRIDKPCAQMPRRVIGIAALAGDLPRRGERRHVQAEPHHGAAVLDEVVGIGHPVALDVRASGIRGIGPPVIGF